MSGDVIGSLLLLGGMLCIMAASYTVCYAIWSRGWEGWESWSARTGLNEEEALAERMTRRK
ncbi:MAG: hypothetical protein AUH85_02120 [Chloroflexi bacterium 13_1_40CM_4_68_4]|nr:MAG: hypothetical protein AUH85_02120 [Chloroflexi bacterium 13_1_40CM_4_68_4]